MKDVIAELAQYDVTTIQMKKIMMKFGPSAVSIIKENPYNLCKIRGIGFKKADVIAQKMGMPDDSPFRICEAIKYVLDESASEGHTWIDRGELKEKAKAAMNQNCRLDLIDNEIENGVDEDVVVINGTRLTLKRYYDAEKFITDYLVMLQSRSTPLVMQTSVDDYVKTLKEQFSTITDEQIKLFYNFYNNNVNLLIGYAGTGKSFITKLLLDMINNKSVLLIAPTGRAAKVIESYTGQKASTIHRAIRIYSPDEDDDDGQTANAELYNDIVIVDESSMCDVLLVAKLLKCLKNPNVRILFIGDDFQIPSVGAGNFLHDMINSNAFTVTKLTQVFRQAEGGVLDVATKVRQNIKFMDNDFVLNLPMEDDKLKFGKDLIIHPCSQDFMLDGILLYYQEAIDNGYTQDDIVILTPMKMGNVGTYSLNKRIQEIINPESPSKNQIPWGRDEKTAIIFREGDRVINIKNNYKAKNYFDEEVVVYNGDMGVIKRIDLVNGSMLIDYGFDDIKMTTKSASLSTIVHAYALTIHKSQGGGYKCVILATDKAHKFMLNANLVYTGITRTKEQMWWLCQPETINYAMNKNMPEQRNCLLSDFLK